MAHKDGHQEDCWWAGYWVVPPVRVGRQGGSGAGEENTEGWKFGMGAHGKQSGLIIAQIGPWPQGTSFICVVMGVLGDDPCL